MKITYQIKKEKVENTYILIKTIEMKHSIGSYRIKSGTKKELEKYFYELYFKGDDLIERRNNKVL